MATLILGTVGQVFGGPIGGLVGTAIGGLVDRSVFGASGKAREQGRISNPAVQSATYGEPIPIIVGRMRAAGNLIWTSGIREQSTASGGGKRSGPATTNFSYSASFAVGLVARQIVEIARIWADGKLIRDTDGSFVAPVTMRLHFGGQDQAVDPLIAAAQTAGGTPAHRGLAYVVFEDLPLADYGNRIPNLTFEIIADTALTDVGDVIAALAKSAGLPELLVLGQFPRISGHIVSRTGSLADAISPLLAICDAAVETDERLRIIGNRDATAILAEVAGDTSRPGEDQRSERVRRSSADFEAGCLELAFYDSTNAYQPGVTRVRRSARATVDPRAISAAMSPDDAKQLALQLLAAGQAGRVEKTLRLPWRHLGLRPGTRLTLEGSSHAWRVREMRFENFILYLDLQRVAPAVPAAALASFALPVMARAGFAPAQAAVSPIGATSLRVLDLPTLPGEIASLPRLWIAGAGASAGWRRAGVSASLDDGASFANFGTLDGGSTIGSTISQLGQGSALGWDRHASVDVELLSDRDWLEGRPAAAVLAGGNLALVGDELIQFVHADALAPQQFRLHGLLRGRRGTEAAIAGHVIGERFVMIDPGRMLAFDPPFEALGRVVRLLPTGSGDIDTPATHTTISGTVLRPLSPVHLRAHVSGGDLLVTWIRRSRLGFAWTDFVDAPLAELAEAYAVTIRHDHSTIWQAQVTQPGFVCSLASLSLESPAPTALQISIRQISAAVGPGAQATIFVALPKQGEMA